MFEINTNKGFECMIPSASEEEEVTVERKSNDRHIKLYLFGYELKLTLSITRS